MDHPIEMLNEWFHNSSLCQKRVYEIWRKDFFVSISVECRVKHSSSKIWFDGWNPRPSILGLTVSQPSDVSRASIACQESLLKLVFRQL